MASYECYDCSDTFLLQDLTERICCRRRLCSECLRDSPECRHCSNSFGNSVTAYIEVNLEQLQREIIRINRLAQEQVEFYFKYGDFDNNWSNLDFKTAFQSDSKAIQLHLELLEELQQRLTSLNDKDKTVLIPEGILVRSKDFYDGEIVDSEGRLVTEDRNKHLLYNYLKIPHSYYGSDESTKCYCCHRTAKKWAIFGCCYMTVCYSCSANLAKCPLCSEDINSCLISSTWIK